jgi:hypothetical protein
MLNTSATRQHPSRNRVHHTGLLQDMDSDNILSKAGTKPSRCLK